MRRDAGFRRSMCAVAPKMAADVLLRVLNALSTDAARVGDDPNQPPLTR
ncbi:hypothetical protein ABIE24_000290 [Mycetocola sp. 2940]